MFEKMTERFEQARTGDLVRLIVQELKADADPIAVATEVRAICLFVNMPIVMGAKPENRAAMVEFQCEELKQALLDFVGCQKRPALVVIEREDIKGGHDA